MSIHLPVNPSTGFYSLEKSQSNVCFKIWLCKGGMDGDKPEAEGNLSESNHETTELLF